MAEDYKATILASGATGFLGQFAIRDLLSMGHRVVALVRRNLAEEYPRFRELLIPIGVDFEQVTEAGQLLLVEGSLPDTLPEQTWGHTDVVFHSAASLKLFANGDGDPFRTNIDGTAAMLEWAAKHDVNRFFSVSTAYTCGWNSGTIRESFHDPRPTFQTDYERSKWMAERLLHEWSSNDGRKLTVFRPSFLVGDSETGYTTQFGGFYQFGRLLHLLKSQYHGSGNGERAYIPLRVPGRPTDYQNIVPIDFASRMIAEVVSRPEFHGRIYHLANPEPPTNALVKECCEEYFGIEGGCFADPNEVVGHFTEAESFLWDQYHLLTPRLAHSPEFDMSHTLEVMRAADVTFPTINRQRLLMLFDWAAQRDWGRGSRASKWT